MEQSQKVNTILKCFVDMNLETNEKFPYDVQILGVSFTESYYTVSESNVVDVVVGLSEPSHNGIEEVDIILSHTSTTPEDINTESFPIHLKWESGEQYKVVSIPVLRDFVEEGDESFMLGITNLVNVVGNGIVQADVLVIDATLLRTVGILAANVNTDVSPLSDPNSFTFNGGIVDRGRLSNAENPLQFAPFISGFSPNEALRDILTFTVSEGEELNVTIGLDKPSQYGVEKLDIAISSAMASQDFDPNSSIGINSSRVEWEIGDQFKTVTLTASLNNAIEGTRSMILEIKNLDGVKFGQNSTRRVQILIKDPPITRRFTTIDFGRIFKQRGSVLSGVDPLHTETELHLRTITDGQVTTTRTLYWLVELGTTYTDETNSPSLSESVNYPEWPLYYFGVNANGEADGVYLRVTNQGIGEIEYNGSTFAVGDSFTLLLARGATTIVLPTNDGLQPAGSIVAQDNLSLDSDTFTESKYRFEIIVNTPQLDIIGGVGTSGPHGFRLKTFSTLPSLYHLGDFNMPNHTTVQASAVHSLGLISSYSNIRTRFDTSSCSNSFDGPNRVHNIRIHGLILLSQNSLESDYISHELIEESSFTPICGESIGNYMGLPWISIPFEIV